MVFMKKTEFFQHITQVRRSVLNWYRKNRRDLPWRHTRDPYCVLVSEIMLQQTQVSRVLIKYQEFLTTFPSVQDLADAKPSEVIKVWAGLGYNRRALYLQKTAKAVVATYHGMFPSDLQQLKQLPGIGDYTARAILSFAFGKSLPMMDTNHRRFYQRVLFGMNSKKDAELLLAAEHVLPRKRAYDWNQALMDFGSLVCLTGEPRCEDCPLQRYCKAYPSVLKIKKTKKPHTKKSIPFRETDRYIRGRIIEQLRQVDVCSLLDLLQIFQEFNDVRVRRIIEDLAREELLVKRGNRIQLP